MLLSQLEASLGLRRRIGLEVLIEEAEGLENAVEIATASSRLETLILGAGDLPASMHARVDTNFQPLHPYPGDFWHYARVRVVAAARAAGIMAIDSPFPNYRDQAAYGHDCDLASLLGFDGKWCIHPSQIPIANDRFSPTAAEVDWARRAKQAYQVAEAKGTGAIAIDGTLPICAMWKPSSFVQVGGPYPRPRPIARDSAAARFMLTGVPQNNPICALPSGGLTSAGHAERRLLARRTSATPPPSVTAAEVPPVPDGAAMVSIPASG